MMDLDRPDGRDAEQIGQASRKPWARPSIKHLRAGSAENVPGARAPDGPIEAIGS